MDLEVEYLYDAPGRQSTASPARIRFAGACISDIAPSVAKNGLLALPALADAHDHARGLHHIGFGAKDQSFELWRAALYAQPPIDPYLNAALAFVVWKLWGENRELQKELRDTHKQQAEFWREVARQVKVEGKP